MNQDYKYIMLHTFESAIHTHTKKYLILLIETSLKVTLNRQKNEKVSENKGR